MATMTTEPKAPNLSGLLSQIPDESRLVFLRDTFGDRAEHLGRNHDPESRAWAGLYEYFTIEVESALLTRRTGVSV